MTILFADVAGSVELHSALGDIQAHRRIMHMLESMSSLIKDHRGRVIEIIGDEIMCAFEESDHALSAACKIQECTRSKREPEFKVRIGLHCGLTNEENGHPYGDTVNVAARVVAIAKAGQIMLTDHVYQALTNQNKLRTRHFSNIYLRGKNTPYTIRQATWEQGSETQLVECSSRKPAELHSQTNHMRMYFHETEMALVDGTELLLGRGEQCDLRVDADNVSRIHAILKFKGGKLILTDRSTNGTFVKNREVERSTDNLEQFLHHDEWITTCGGVISLGKPISSENNDLIFISRF
jgi:hypothetical protein